MNLHDLNEKPQPWGLVHPYGLADILRDYPLENYQQRWYDETVRYYRQTPLRAWDLAADFETVEVRTRGRTREGAMEVARVLRELDWQYVQLVQRTVRPADLQRAAFTIRRWEWDLLRASLDWFELQRHMGEQTEGAAPTYRGYPVVIW